MYHLVLTPPTATSSRIEFRAGISTSVPHYPFRSLGLEQHRLSSSSQKKDLLHESLFKNSPQHRSSLSSELLCSKRLQRKRDIWPGISGMQSQLTGRMEARTRATAHPNSPPHQPSLLSVTYNGATGLMLTAISNIFLREMAVLVRLHTLPWCSANPHTQDHR